MVELTKMMQIVFFLETKYLLFIRLFVIMGLLKTINIEYKAAEIISRL